MGKRKIINMNYPSADTPPKKVTDFWGEPAKEDRNLLDKIKVKGNKKNEPCPV